MKDSSQEKLCDNIDGPECTESMTDGENSEPNQANPGKSTADPRWQKLCRSMAAPECRRSKTDKIDLDLM